MNLKAQSFHIKDNSERSLRALFRPEACTFGKVCPADNHYASEAEAQQLIDQLTEAIELKLDSPLPGVSGDVFFQYLSKLKDNDTESVRVSGLTKGNETDPEAILTEMANEGFVNGQFMEITPITDGVLGSTSKQICFSELHQYFGSQIECLHSTLSLSKAGESVLSDFQAQKKVADEAETKRRQLLNSTYKLQNLNNQLKKLKNPPAKHVLPPVTKLFWERTELLIKQTPEGAYWDTKAITQGLGCSRGTARTFAANLTSRGILTEDTERNWITGHRLTVFYANHTAIKLAGGLSSVLGPKPE